MAKLYYDKDISSFTKRTKSSSCQIVDNLKLINQLFKIKT